LGRIFDKLLGTAPEPQRSIADVDWYIGLLQDALAFGGVGYPFVVKQTQVSQNEEEPGGFDGYSAALFKGNPVIFGLMEARRRLFCQARFVWQQVIDGGPSRIFGSSTLGLLENPWPNGFTSDLLSRMIQDVDLEGNAFIARTASDRLFRLRPDWTTILAASPRSDAQIGDPDVDILGYLYKPGGRYSNRTARRFLVEEVAHFAPTPDPEASFRGMSWLTPVIREVMSDNAATLHKLNFFANGATPNMVVKLDAQNLTKFREYVDLFRREHEGADNAYRTLFLAGGADATVVGSNFEQMDFKVVQAAGEVRMAMAAGVQPIIGGLSEGLDASTFSNYGQARRAFADLTIRPLWQSASESLQPIVDFPPNASRSTVRLWYADASIPFLQDDQKDKAEVQQAQASAINTLITVGFDPDAAVTAVTADDFSQLTGQHNGLPSVQLQQGSPQSPNGNGNQAVPAQN
jgi:phage portal protein BeeE